MERGHSVYVKERKLPSGKISFYLDVFVKKSGGKRTYIKLPISSVCRPTTPAKRYLYREARGKAESERDKLQVQLNDNPDCLGRKQDSEVEQWIVRFVGRKTELRALGSQRRVSRSGYSANYAKSFSSMLNYFRAFLVAKRLAAPKFSDIDSKFIVAFKNFLVERVAPRSCAYYTRLLCTAVKEAFEDGQHVAPGAWELPTRERVEIPKSQRAYLTYDEIARLAATPCHDELLKRTFLFCCFTALRYGDAVALSREHIVYLNGVPVALEFRQEKTKNAVTLPLSEQARQYLELQLTETAQGDKLFPLRSSGATWGWLRAWVKAAGIEKSISFHSSRHTAATMLLSNGTSIETVSALLGHTNIKTTQIYSKVTDTRKAEAVNRLPVLPPMNESPAAHTEESHILLSHTTGEHP